MEIIAIEQLAKAFAESKTMITAVAARETLATYLGKKPTDRECKFLMLRYRHYVSGAKGMRVSM